MSKAKTRFRDARGTWPILMACVECGHPGGRVYPYPSFEDADDFEAGAEEMRNGRTIGTFWCPRCSPFWGEALLQFMTMMAIARGTGAPEEIEPGAPLLGGLPVEAVAFLESELADFLDGPGPLSRLRPGWYGEGPVAPRSEEFVWACADLVSWMRDAGLAGALWWRNNQWTTLMPVAS